MSDTRFYQGKWARGFDALHNIHGTGTGTGLLLSRESEKKYIFEKQGHLMGSAYL